jgi:outer membrane protein assembly complex protein YaeT
MLRDHDSLDQYQKLEWIQNEQGQVEWVTEKALLIRNISIKSGMRSKIQIEKIKNKYIGKLDTPYTQQALMAELLEYFAYTGYPYAEIQWTQENARKSTSYDIVIHLGKPCVITKIQSAIKLPEDVPLNLEIGDICDRERIHDELESFEKHLTEEGFQNSHIQILDTQYSKDYSEMQLILGGQIGNRVTFEFIDESRMFISNALDEATSTYLQKNYSNPELVKEQVYEYFKSRGFEFVTVKGPFKQTEKDGSVSYFFYINPGPRYQCSELVVEGTVHLSVEDIKDAVLTSKFLDMFSDDESKSIDLVKSKLIDFYHTRGFWDVRILKTRMDYPKTAGLANIHISLDEGSQRILKKVTIAGNKNLTNVEIEALFHSKPSSFLHYEEISNLEFKIREKYFELGYLHAEVSVTLNSELNNDLLETSINILVDEQRISHIKDIHIRGLIDTEPYVVERELLFARGDIYNQVLIDQTRNALLNLGIFSSVSLERSQFLEKDNVDLIINIREGDSGRIKFGPGYNFDRGLQYAGEISYYNLYGTGRRISLRGAMSQEKQQRSISLNEDKNGKTLLGRKIGVSYAEPYLFHWPITGNVSVYHQAIADDIWKISDTFEVSLTHIFDGSYFKGSVTPFYRFQLLRDEGTPNQRDSLVTTGFSKIASLGIRYRLDKRDSLSFPTSGFLFNTEMSLARYEILSQYKYYKWHISNSFYLKLIKGVVFALSTSLTSFQDVRRKDVSSENVDVLPANQRLLAGGSSDVRGFDQQLGPYVYIKNTNGYSIEPPLGGSQLLIFKTELRKEIIPDFFSMSLFWDLGNSFFTTDELNIFTKKFNTTNTSLINRSVEDNFNYNFKSLLTHPELLLKKNYQSIGFSMGLLTPLGAINASLGWPLKEPISENCKERGLCNFRAKEKNTWIEKVQVDFNIGAEF